MVRFLNPLPTYPREKILIIGTGHIGKMIAKKVKALDMICYGINTSGHPAEGMEKLFL